MKYTINDNKLLPKILIFMDNKNLFKYIKTPCGQSKYIELQSNKSLVWKIKTFLVCNYCFYKRLEY